MASLEIQKGWYRVVLRNGGQKHQKALETQDEGEALRLKARIEDNLRLLERGRLEFPGGDLITFLLSDGKLNAVPSIRKAVTLGQMLDEYEKACTQDKEASTARTEKIHFGHFRRVLGPRTPLAAIDAKALQGYIATRAKEAGRRGARVSHATIKKEMGTLSSVWNQFAVPQGLIGKAAPTKGLHYPKQREKAPFQTWTEIKRKCGSKPDDELWDSLFLTTDEVAGLLEFVKANARHDFLYPMIAFAAHTGARRSEMMRSRREDFDFASDMVMVREKKKDTSKTFTFRHVPLSPLVKEAMQQWFKEHPGGDVTFCVLKDLPLSPQLAHHHLRWLLDDTKWSVIKGWHVLRHSFITACVMKGIDQRMIDLWVGHTTEAMRRRYTHLIPSAAKQALASVFG